MTDDPNAYILEVGRMIIEDPSMSEKPWDAIASVATLEEDEGELTTYRYFGEGDFEAQSLREFSDVIDALVELREAMEVANGDTWKQCLIQITKPDYEVKMQFEYDDAERWTPKEVSLDMSSFANSIKP